MLIQLIICLVVSLGFSLLALLYFIKKDKAHCWSMVTAMGLGLIAFSLLCNYLGGISILREIEYLSMIAICFPLAWIDVMEKKIPNTIVLAGLIVQVALFIIWFIYDDGQALDVLKSAGIGLLVICIFCGIGLLIVKNGIGMGDVKLLLVLALMGGIDGILSVLFFTMVVAFFIALFELLVRKKGRKATIPFAPSIMIGVVVTNILLVFS